MHTSIIAVIEVLRQFYINIIFVRYYANVQTNPLVLILEAISIVRLKQGSPHSGAHFCPLRLEGKKHPLELQLSENCSLTESFSPSVTKGNIEPIINKFGLGRTMVGFMLTQLTDHPDFVPLIPSDFLRVFW